MGVQSETSKVGLIGTVLVDKEARQRSLVLKLLGITTSVLAGYFFTNLLVLAGLCFGYSNDISDCQRNVLAGMLVIGVVQAILGLLSTTKLFALRLTDAYQKYVQLIKPFIAVNSMISLLAASQAIICMMFFIVADSGPAYDLSGFAIGWRLIGIAAGSLVAISCFSLLASAISMVVVACMAPNKYSQYAPADCALPSDQLLAEAMSCDEKVEMY